MQGADGHIYKGRMGTKLEARLPSVTQVTEGETTRFWFRVFLGFFLCLWFQRGFTSISKTLFPELRKNAGCLMKSSEYLFYSAYNWSHFLLCFHLRSLIQPRQVSWGYKIEYGQVHDCKRTYYTVYQ